MPPPAVPYSPQKTDKTEIALVVLILVVVVVLPIVLAGVLYVLVMGVGTPQSSPTASLVPDTGSADGLNFTVTSVSSPVDLPNVQVQLYAPSDTVYMNAGFNLSSSSNVSELNSGIYTIAYYDMDDNGLLSNGDRVTVRPSFGTLEDGSYHLALMATNSGGIIAQTDVTLP